jgi:ribonuclease VapC
MVIDTSAVVAIARAEPERGAFLQQLAQAPSLVIAAATWTESRIVIFSRSGEAGLTALDELKAAAGIEIVPVTEPLADLAFEAFRRFGKGRHPAGLNLGDCFSYALAKERNEPLLFKGDDFPRTDVSPAITI